MCKELEDRLAAVEIQKAELKETLEAAEEDGHQTRDKLRAAEKSVKEASLFLMSLPHLALHTLRFETGTNQVHRPRTLLSKLGKGRSQYKRNWTIC